MVITIIVLLVLAGITIAMIVGQDSVPEKAVEAREKQEEAAKQEEIRLKEIGSKLETEWDGTIATGYAGGTGTQSDPYLIENGSQLAYLASQVNSGETYEGKYFSIVKSINLGNKEFTPIGLGEIGVFSYNSNWSTTRKFKGTLDGNNNVITGLNINQPNNSGVGLIGVLETGGEVRNLVVYEGEVIGLIQIGGIVGASRGNIINCQNSAKVEARSNSTNNTGDIAGGIAGLISNGKIEYCKNYGSIKTNNVANSMYSGKISGGIVGLAGFNKTEETIEINNCINYGEIIVDYRQAGGIVGRLVAGTITNCYNVGNIEAKSNRGSGYAGGIVGSQVGGSINKVYNSGDVKVGNYSGKDSAGGIVGYQNNASATITNAYNKGQVSLAQNPDTEDLAGGIVAQKVAGSVSNTFYYTTDANLKGIGGVENDPTITKLTTKIINSLEEFLRNMNSL